MANHDARAVVEEQRGDGKRGEGRGKKGGVPAIYRLA